MDLKDVGIQSISLGKAHAVALNNKGQIYTFGINNKGQCGRDYAAGSSKECKLKRTCYSGGHCWDDNPGVLFLSQKSLQLIWRL